MPVLSLVPKKRIKNRRFLLTLAFLSLDIQSEYNLTTPWNDVYTNAIDQLDDYEVKSGSILWLVDRFKGDCLGSHGFGECGDVNLWKMSMFDDAFFPYSSHIRFESFDVNHFSENTYSNNPICLGRKEKFGGVPYHVEAKNCNPLLFSKSTLTNWNFDSTSGKIYAHSWFHEPYCLIRVEQQQQQLYNSNQQQQYNQLDEDYNQETIEYNNNNNNGKDTKNSSNRDEIRIQSCDLGYTAFNPVVLRNSIESEFNLPIETIDEKEKMQLSYSFSSDEYSLVSTSSLSSSSSSSSSSSNSDMNSNSNSNPNSNPNKVMLLNDKKKWICPATGLEFPVYIHYDEPVDSPPHQLMGGNIYPKTVFGMTFKVYTVALYVEAEKAKADRSLMPFVDLSATQLVNSPLFYKALMSPVAQYDRTLVIKFAMSVNSDDILNGLVTELSLQPDNSMALAALFIDHKAKKCPRGMELSFRWRVKNNNNNNLKIGQNNNNDNNNNNNDNNDHSHPINNNNKPNNIEIFEVRMDSVLLAKLILTNISADFFDKFITNQEPVSPLAKISFADNFPRLLSTKRSNCNNNRQKRDNWNNNGNNDNSMESNSNNNNRDMKGSSSSNNNNSNNNNNNNKHHKVVTVVNDPVFLAGISSNHFNVKRMVINAVQEMETHIHYPHNHHHHHHHSSNNKGKDSMNSNTNDDNDHIDSSLPTNHPSVLSTSIPSSTISSSSSSSQSNSIPYTKSSSPPPSSSSLSIQEYTFKIIRNISLYFSSQLSRQKVLKSLFSRVLIRRRKVSIFMDIFTTICVLIYSIVLIMVSLPPARQFVKKQTAIARRLITTAGHKITTRISLIKRSLSLDELAFRRYAVASSALRERGSGGINNSSNSSNSSSGGVVVVDMGVHSQSLHPSSSSVSVYSTSSSSSSSSQSLYHLDSSAGALFISDMTSCSGGSGRSHIKHRSLKFSHHHHFHQHHSHAHYRNRQYPSSSHDSTSTTTTRPLHHHMNHTTTNNINLNERLKKSYSNSCVVAIKQTFATS